MRTPRARTRCGIVVQLAAAVLMGVVLTPAPAAAWWATICFLASTGTDDGAAVDFFGDKGRGRTSCRNLGDLATYYLSAVYRNGVRLRPVVLYATYRRSAYPRAATVAPFPPRYVEDGDAYTWRCKGSSTKSTAIPTRCSDGQIRLDVTLPRAYVDGTPLPQLTLVAKYRTGVDVGHITVSTGTPRGGFVNGWVPETLADLVATCLPPGPSVNCGYR
jgi:hypothetical protein